MHALGGKVYRRLSSDTGPGFREGYYSATLSPYYAEPIYG